MTMCDNRLLISLCIGPFSTQCKDATIKNFVIPIDYSTPSGNVAFGEGDGAKDDGENICDTLAANISAAVIASVPACSSSLANNSNTCSKECRDAVSAILCDDERFATAVNQCGKDVGNALGGCSVPRCPARTRQGCQCKKNWNFRERGSTLRGDYTNHSCGNPERQRHYSSSTAGQFYVGTGAYFHTTDFCEIVPGSCNTPSGNPERTTEYNFDHYIKAFCECPHDFGGCDQDSTSCTGCGTKTKESTCSSAGRTWRQVTYFDECGTGNAA